ncbi:putative adenine-specific DNA-methyltransferase [Helicobacter muridarum]|uniref:Putative adenine-specific DNA-methyltransferase n=1 Tax=Helicobacter muridarum TaxID=216 RepID=A0A377PSG1_9HELI|nr:putative adenine-specific DNA-methyltransferase [Helicobacter muridarum]
MKANSHISKPTFISTDSTFCLYQGDCNAFLLQMKETFDLIFADPPYFLSNNSLSIPRR